MEEQFDPKYQKLCDAKESARTDITTRKPEYILYPNAPEQRETCINVFDKVIDISDTKNSRSPMPGITKNCDNFDKETPCIKSECPHYLKYLAYIKAGAMLKQYQQDNHIGEIKDEEVVEITFRQKWENFKTEWRRLSELVRTRRAEKNTCEHTITLNVSSDGLMQSDETPTIETENQGKPDRWCITKFYGVISIEGGQGIERANEIGRIFHCNHFCHGYQKCNEECKHKDAQNAYVDAVDAYDAAWNARWNFVKNTIKSVFMKVFSRSGK